MSCNLGWDKALALTKRAETKGALAPEAALGFLKTRRAQLINEVQRLTRFSFARLDVILVRPGDATDADAGCLLM